MRRVIRSAELDRRNTCKYSNYMPDRELRITRIGNSRGVRLPAETLRRYGISDSVLMEERADGIFLRPTGAIEKLSWEETAREMAAAAEDWSEWDAVSADGLDDIPWTRRTGHVRRMAETSSEYGTTRRSRKRP